MTKREVMAMHLLSSMVNNSRLISSLNDGKAYAFAVMVANNLIEELSKQNENT
jgi:hypothetical protein